MALARAFTPFTPALLRTLHTSAPSLGPSSAATARADHSAAASTLQGLLGLSGDQARTMLALHPAIGEVKPSVLLERVQFLASGLGISSARLRSMVLEKPALLSDLSMRELRTLAGLSS